MRAVWSLLCFLHCTLPAAAAENWFLPYEPDAHTIVLVHLDGPQAGERAEARTPAQVTLTDNAQHADGRFSGGVALAGPKQCVRVDGVPRLILDNDADFTVELWCRPKTAASASLFSLGTRFYCTIDPGRGTASFGYRSADFPIRWFPVTGVPIRRNRWQHVAVTHDGNRVVRFYVNGALAATPVMAPIQ